MVSGKKKLFLYWKSNQYLPRNVWENWWQICAGCRTVSPSRVFHLQSLRDWEVHWCGYRTLPQVLFKKEIPRTTKTSANMRCIAMPSEEDKLCNCCHQCIIEPVAKYPKPWWIWLVSQGWRVSYLSTGCSENQSQMSLLNSCHADARKHRVPTIKHLCCTWFAMDRFLCLSWVCEHCRWSPV